MTGNRPKRTQSARTLSPPTLSARGRIVGWMLLLTAIALAGSIVATWELLAIRADTRTAEHLELESTRFRAFAASPAAQEHQAVRALLDDYLQDSVPDAGETMFSIVDGRPHRRSPIEPPARLDTDPAFVAQVASATTPTSGWWDSSAGRVRYAVLPVTVAGAPETGALVLVQFRDVQAAPLLDSVRILALVATLALLGAGATGWLVAGRVLAPVRAVRETADQIGEGDLHRRIEVDGSDDIAQLSATFNRMLDRLEGAMTTQRRFLDDAGHELRTPITVIRGHLELLGTAPAERAEDRAATVALVLDELERMNRIVQDLLDLARAERPDFLHLGPVDLTDLVVDALDRARVLGERHWSVDELPDLDDEPAPVTGDQERLLQALIQLASNAVRHTKDGDTIAFGARHRGGQVSLWVRDTGTGVDPREAPQLFQRFRRGAATSRDSDGAGLGLAIVASIAQAHGGTARVVPSPGPGATFVIELPARDLAGEAADADHTRDTPADQPADHPAVRRPAEEPR